MHSRNDIFTYNHRIKQLFKFEMDSKIDSSMIIFTSIIVYDFIADLKKAAKEIASRPLSKLASFHGGNILRLDRCIFISTKIS